VKNLEGHQPWKRPLLLPQLCNATQDNDGLKSFISSLLCLLYKPTYPHTHQTAPPPLCFDYMVDLLPPFWLFLERKKKGKKKVKTKPKQIKSNQLIDWCQG